MAPLHPTILYERAIVANQQLTSFYINRSGSSN